MLVHAKAKALITAVLDPKEEREKEEVYCSYNVFQCINFYSSFHHCIKSRVKNLREKFSQSCCACFVMHANTIGGIAPLLRSYRVATSNSGDSIRFNGTAVQRNKSYSSCAAL